MDDPFAIHLALSILLGLAALIVALLAGGHPWALVLSLLMAIPWPSPP